jgi:hypothetical protein
MRIPGDYILLARAMGAARKTGVRDVEVMICRE